MSRYRILLLAQVVFYLSLGACTASSSQYMSAPSPKPLADRPQVLAMVDMKSLPETVGTEHQDRVNRFNRLAAMNGITPPEVTELQLPPGEVPGLSFGVPVVRVVFDEKVFFDSGKDYIRPEAAKVLDVMAQNMRRDVPDAKLTILGHTDWVGTDAYNIQLSRKRALSVMQELIKRGVRISQLSTVAIGKKQPIADNKLEEGRARNRRVEFVISASQTANISIITHRRVDAGFLETRPVDSGQRATTPTPLSALTPDDVEVSVPVQTQTANQNDLSAPANQNGLSTPVKQTAAVDPPIVLRDVGKVKIRPPEQESQYHPVVPTEYHKRSLDEDYAY